MAIGLTAALVSAALFGVAAVWQAMAVRDHEAETRSAVAFVGMALTTPLLLLVIGAYLAGFVLHAVAIWTLPLYLAQATISLSMPVTAIISAHRLHEPLGAFGWGAVAAVTVGIGVVAAGAGAPGETTSGWLLPGVSWAMVVACTAVGLWLLRRGGHTRMVLLGLVAGCGYAGSAIAVRGVTGSISPEVITVALAVPTLGAVAFWLYSVSLEGVAVTTSTAALIVSETLVPALVGVALLGDGVRPGWWPAVAAGFALAIGGAVALAHPGRVPMVGQAAQAS
ncbi:MULTISPECIES: hypothetical protein [unclassified Nocardioides]|uniref:hypothetical protein n=1 Tax=unclassified Nocardioides TaxID=2615069 RepID=UPI0006F61913|nr:MULTISPECIES: hypothetical protein [unclassified Nocardioides]KQY63888.1 hypothetical protein ASD30_02590 [Nocardioides sp. Root140]KRF15902.1 hypothetical protein ASH02_04590 [Nocardioides sp. Soil796]